MSQETEQQRESHEASHASTSSAPLLHAERKLAGQAVTDEGA